MGYDANYGTNNGGDNVREGAVLTKLRVIIVVLLVIIVALIGAILGVVLKSEDHIGTVSLIPRVSPYDYPPTPFLIDQINYITNINIGVSNNDTKRSCGNGITINNGDSSNATAITNATKTDASNMTNIVGTVIDDYMTSASDKADDGEETMTRCYVAIASSDFNRDNFLSRGNEYIRMLHRLAAIADTNATISLNSLSVGFWETNSTMFDIYDQHAIAMNYYGHNNDNAITNGISKQVYVYGTKPRHQDDYSASDMKRYIDSFCRDVICELNRVNFL